MQTNDKPFNPVGALRGSRVASRLYFTMDHTVDAPLMRPIADGDPIPLTPEGSSFLGVSL